MVEIDEHIRRVLARHAVDTGLYSPVRGVQAMIDPALRRWGTQYIVDIRPSGSFAKGTAVNGGTDIDIFISLTSTLSDTLQSIYDTSSTPTDSFLNVFGSSAVTVKAEYLHYDLGNETLRFPGVNGGAQIGGYTSRVRTDGDIVRADINYKF